jgi:hypothetical protein
VALVQDICTELQQHCISTAATLEKCVQAKECIVPYYDHIKQQLKADDELYKVQKDQLRNKEQHWKHHGGSYAVHTNTVLSVLLV